jgi:hypothetical protein
MNIVLTETEAKFILLKHFGLEVDKRQRDELIILQTPHTVTIIKDEQPKVAVPPKVDDVPDEAYAVGYPSKEAIENVETE